MIYLHAIAIIVVEVISRKGDDASTLHSIYLLEFIAKSSFENGHKPTTLILRHCWIDHGHEIAVFVVDTNNLAVKSTRMRESDEAVVRIWNGILYQF